MIGRSCTRFQGFTRLLINYSCYTHAVSIRLQVLLPEKEVAEIRRLAEQENLSVGEWVRRTLRDARARQSLREPGLKLKALRKAAACSYPVADLDQMLGEIEKGYIE